MWRATCYISIERTTRGNIMKTSQHHTFRKLVPNSRQLDQIKIHSHQEIANQAMLLSYDENYCETNFFEEEECESFIKGYN